MPRHVAFLRGVSPMNAKMPELARAFERAGLTAVRTVLSSGNVAFDTTARSEARIAKLCEAAMGKHLGRTFATIVRPTSALDALLDADPFSAFRIPAGAKRVVTFLREPPGKRLALPLEIEGARILAVQGREAFTVYVPGPRGPVFMVLIEKTFGTDVTTRTWDTVRRCASA